MPEQEDRRYGISQVSQQTGVSAHLLRQWEARFPPLKPRRDRANRRCYTTQDIDIVRRIKQLLRHEKMTTKGAARKLAKELYGEGSPKTSREAEEIIDKIETEARSMIDLLDRDTLP